MKLYFDTSEEALAVNQRITNDCLSAGIWGSGTTNYCNPYQDEETGQWVLPIIEGYEQFFTSFELSIANQNMQPEVREVLQDKWFCKQIQVKLLAAFKTMPTLNQGTYRQMSDIFWYAKDAADNGNPTNLKIELQAIPDEATLGLAGWDALRSQLIAEIDAYLA